MRKMISWNVNGLRACVGKGFLEYVKESDADIFCIQESQAPGGTDRAGPSRLPPVLELCREKGILPARPMFTKEEPVSVSYGLGIPEHDKEGRVITAEFDDYYVVTCYTPNSQDGLKRLDYRMEWEDAFLSYLKKLEEKKPVVFCGDLNVAHKEIDLKNPKTNRKNAALRTRKEKNSQDSWMRASSTPGDTLTRIWRAFTLGGPTGFLPARRTPGGASTISAYRTA